MNGIASNADTGTSIAQVCRSILGRTTPPQARRLAYDIVKCGGLADSDWDEVTKGMQGDMASNAAVEVRSCAHLRLLKYPTRAAVGKVPGQMLCTGKTARWGKQQH